MAEAIEVQHGLSVEIIDGVEHFHCFCKYCGFTLESIYDEHFCENDRVLTDIKAPAWRKL